MNSHGVDTSRATISQLEKVSQKHEANIVVELGIDRLVQWIGVYVLTALATIVKLTDIISGSGLLCYPANSSVRVDSNLIQYSSAYCWETSQTSNISDSCYELTENRFKFLQDPYSLKVLLFALPYFLLGQSLFFATMWALWHFRFGARLQGHLRFMQLLLEDIFTQLKFITRGFYAARPYDRTSIYFDGLRKYESVEEIEKREMEREEKMLIAKFEREEAAQRQVEQANQPKASKPAKVKQEKSKKKAKPSQTSNSSTGDDSEQTNQREEVIPLINLESSSSAGVTGEGSASSNNLSNGTPPENESNISNSSTVGETQQPSNTSQPNGSNAPNSSSSNNNASSQAQTGVPNEVSVDVEMPNKDEEITKFEAFIVGEMRDQHFFSMLCSENFSSLHHLPYILSVFKLTGKWGAEDKEDKPKRYYVDEGILKLWCHSKNLNQVRLIKWYLLKHIITAFAALIMVIFLLVMFGVYLSGDFNSSETFRCELPLEDLCVLCTVKRKAEIYTVLFFDVAITSVIMVMSFGTWIVVRRSKDLVTSCFFRQIKDVSNIALSLAWHEREEAMKKEKASKDQSENSKEKPKESQK